MIIIIKMMITCIGNYSHIYRTAFLTILASTYHIANAIILGWETVASTNRTDRFWTGSEPEFDYEDEEWSE